VTDTNRILNTKHSFMYLPLIVGVSGFCRRMLLSG